jgi:hypothetical protein
MVAELPAGVKEPPAVKLAYLVDSQGNASNCSAYPDNRQPQVLVDLACKQLFAQLPRSPVSSDGATVPAVKTAAVLFTVGK